MDRDNSDGHWVVWWQEVFCEAVAFCLSTTADGDNQQVQRPCMCHVGYFVQRRSFGCAWAAAYLGCEATYADSIELQGMRVSCGEAATCCHACLCRSGCLLPSKSSLLLVDFLDQGMSFFWLSCAEVDALCHEIAASYL